VQSKLRRQFSFEVANLRAEVAVACGQDIDELWTTWVQELQNMMTYTGGTLVTALPTSATEIVRLAYDGGNSGDSSGDGGESLAQRVQTEATEKMLAFADQVVKELEEKKGAAQTDVRDPIQSAIL